MPRMDGPCARCLWVAETIPGGELGPPLDEGPNTIDEAVPTGARARTAPLAPVRSVNPLLEPDDPTLPPLDIEDLPNTSSVQRSPYRPPREPKTEALSAAAIDDDDPTHRGFVPRRREPDLARPRVSAMARSGATRTRSAADSSDPPHATSPTPATSHPIDEPRPPRRRWLLWGTLTVLVFGIAVTIVGILIAASTGLIDVERLTGRPLPTWARLDPDHLSSADDSASRDEADPVKDGARADDSPRGDDDSARGDDDGAREDEGAVTTDDQTEDPADGGEPDEARDARGNTGVASGERNVDGGREDISETLDAAPDVPPSPAAEAPRDPAVALVSFRPKRFSRFRHGGDVVSASTKGSWTTVTVAGIDAIVVTSGGLTGERRASAVAKRLRTAIRRHARSGGEVVFVPVGDTIELVWKGPKSEPVDLFQIRVSDLAALKVLTGRVPGNINRAKHLARFLTDLFNLTVTGEAPRWTADAAFVAAAHNYLSLRDQSALNPRDQGALNRLAYITQ